MSAAIVLGVAGFIRFVDAIWAFSHHGVLPENLEGAIFGHSGMPGRPWADLYPQC